VDQRRNLDSGGGEGVLIGIIDVQGFDFAHQDFLDKDGNTRFLRIWDQAGDRRNPPAGFPYGGEITSAHLAAALKVQKTQGIPATVYEPQSSMVDGSHGTHVASIAAGNLGVCHKAGIVAVLLSLPDSDEDRRRSFYDSTRLGDAVDYLLKLSEELGRPISINVSLGTNGHAHDGSSGVSRWIDSALVVPGRAVCVAAGNAGQEAPDGPDDLGYIMGRIHTSGRIPAAGLSADIDWLVLGSGLADISENELEIWYSPADRFAVSVKPPGGSWTAPLDPGEFIENRQLPDGSFFSVYNELYQPANGANYISVYLSPFLSETAIKGVPAGTWRVRLLGREVRDGRYHGWIERDDPQRRDSSGTFWSFPSFFAGSSNVDHSSVSSLACGHNVIGVGNLDPLREKVNVSSSQGPTRDGRAKPDIAAPGTEVVAARGFHGVGEEPWIAMTGTSMASPYVAGVVGLMLARKRALTAAQVLGILQRTAHPLPGHDYVWRDDVGYGRLSPAACLAELDVFDQRKDRT
jgi:subtilisin family serine protease